MNMVHTRKSEKKIFTLDVVDSVANGFGWNVLGKGEERKYVKPNLEVRFLKRKGMYKTMVYSRGKIKNVDVSSRRKEAYLYLTEMLMFWGI